MEGGGLLKIIVAFAQLEEQPSALDQGRDCVVPGARTCSLLTGQPQGVKKTLARAARAGGTVRYGSTDESSN